MAPVPVLCHRAASRIVVEANIAQCHHVVYEVAESGVVINPKFLVLRSVPAGIYGIHPLIGEG